MELTPKKLKCKVCQKECFAGRRGLCDYHYKLELKAKEKEKLKVKKEKVIKKKVTQKFNRLTVKDLYPLAQKVARHCKDAPCVSCGEFPGVDGGHFIPKGTGQVLALYIENINPQCQSCNRFQEGQQYLHGEWIKKNRGEDTLNFLLRASKITYKFSKIELHQWKKDLTEALTIENKQESFQFIKSRQENTIWYQFLKERLK